MDIRPGKVELKDTSKRNFQGEDIETMLRSMEKMIDCYSKLIEEITHPIFTIEGSKIDLDIEDFTAKLNHQKD